jgi:predicted GNAT superfamily acetyltransferase
VLDCRGMREILVREARERGDYDACVRLQREVWGLSDLEVTSAIQLVATVHAGGLLLVAEVPGEGVAVLTCTRTCWPCGRPPAAAAWAGA